MSFETRPAILTERAAPLARGVWCWPALATGAALVLDALRPLAPEAGARGPLWLDLAALVCLAWATLGPRRARRTGWATPLDGRILAGFVLAVLHVVQLRGAEEPVMWLRQIAASGVCFYALGARLRRDARSPDAVWPAFALIALSLATYALGSATGGLSGLEAATSVVDLRWASRFGLAKALLLATILCVGRASEPGTRAAWRMTALVGVLATALSWVAGGAGLSVASLASLDEPFYFGNSIVAFMVLAGLSRMAWLQSGEVPAQAGRWRAAAAMFPVLAALLVFGGTSGGEGVRAIACLAGAAVTAARLSRRAAAARPDLRRAADPPQARAA